SAVAADNTVVPIIIELKHSDENIGSDSTPPQISLFDSESQRFYTDEFIQMTVHEPDSVYQLQGFVADESGIAGVLIDDITVKHDSTGRFSHFLRVAVADTIVTRIEAVDRSGLSSSVYVIVINELVDTAAPEILITSPRVVRGRLRGIGRRSRTRKVTVDGIYTDQSLISGIYVNGIEASITSDSTFSAEITLKSNDKTFQVTAVDQYDNRETSLFQILDDDQAEAAVRLSPDFLEEDPEYAVVDVFYATDRLDTSKSDPKDKFRGERGELSYGRTIVSIPQGHQVGELESPSWLKFEFREDPAKHIVLLEVTPMDQGLYFSEINHSLGETGSNSAFVYVHGYKTSFEDAARRTAQLVYDRSYDGIPFFYSWPSDGSVLKYTADEADVRWTVPHLKEFLLDIVENTDVENFHIIAHSMGNRAVADALVDIARDYDEPLFNQVILSAPDIDADIFVRDIAPAITKVADRITLYASSRDRALQVSKTIHGYPRLGETGDHLVLIEGIDTVDASSINTDLLGHSYFAETQPLLEDLYDILSQGLAPAARNLIPRVRDLLDYWLLLIE
ncbi:MAG: alpha/beta hydrolase, partial [Bacteroidetes bacterium]|nr:alpha/beta hydrolase [Bacteroidota bacterium]